MSDLNTQGVSQGRIPNAAKYAKPGFVPNVRPAKAKKAAPALTSEQLLAKADDDLVVKIHRAKTDEDWGDVIALVNILHSGGNLATRVEGQLARYCPAPFLIAAGRTDLVRAYLAEVRKNQH